MVYIPKEILLSILEYDPYNKLYVPNDIIHDHIQSLDPTFDLYHLYRSLLVWHQQYNTVINSKYYNVYKLLDDNGGNYYISSGYIVCDNVNAIQLLLPGSNIVGNKINVGYATAVSIRDITTNINRVMYSHPLTIHKYIGNICNTGNITYRYQHYDTSIVRSYSKYDEKIYNAITTLDPNISMRSLLEYTVRKVSMEAKSNIYRNKLGSMVNNIHMVSSHNDNSVIIDWDIYGNIDNILYDILPSTDGWVHKIDEEGSVSSIYIGYDYMDIMMSIVLIDRINGMYPIPNVEGSRPIMY